MNVEKIYLKIIIAIFLSISLLNSQLVKQTYNNPNQIPAVLPTCIIQDSYGFIWIGDREGLVKYDGYSLKRYKQTPFDTTSLSNNFVSDIKEDSSGNLWIATRGGGLNYFNQKTERFIHYRHNPDALNSLGSNDILKILVEEDGSLWVGTFANGFTHLSWDSGGKPIYKQYSARNQPKDITYYTILDMYKDKNGILWIGSTGMGLQRLNTTSGELKTYLHNPQDASSISHNFVSSICEDGSGSLWVGTGFSFTETGGGLNKFDPVTEKFKHFRHNPYKAGSLSSDIVTSLMIDRDRGLWIGTSRGGLNYIALKDIDRKNEPKFIKAMDGSIAAIYEDRLGNVWVAPRTFYLKKYDYRQNPFVYLKHKPGNPNSLGHNSGYSLFIDKQQNLWIGHTKNGVTCYNLRTKKYRRYSPDPNSPNSLSNSKITSICQDNKGRIWFGTSLHGIDILDPVNSTFTYKKANPQDSTALINNYIRHLLKRQNGDIWVALEKDGLQLYDAEHQRFINLDTHDTAIERSAIYALCEDRTGKLWVGSANNGLYGITIKERAIDDIEHFSYNHNDINSINSNGVNDIIEDREHELLWITTNGGLNSYDMRTGKFTHITERDGFPTSFLLTLLQDNSGKLWITTSKGLSRYNPHSGEIINYDEADGLPHTSFGGGTKRNVKTPGDTLFFGGGGVTGFNLKKIIDNPNIPPIKLVDFKLFDKSVKLDTTIQFKNKIILNYDQNVFSFEFVALNFTNPDQNQYAYKIEGFHNDWIYTGTERTASFTNLDPGEYVFRAKGSNNHGIWNEEGTSIKIIIMPPWWKTNWAYAGYALFIFLILYGLRQYEIKRQRLKQDLELEHKQAKKLQEIDRMKSRFFANISHEFRTPLTLILGPIEKVLSKTVDTETQNELSMMQRNAKRLQRLINQLLDLSKLESGGMTLQLAKKNIVEMIRQYTQSFESLAKQKGIELIFRAEEENISAFIDRDIGRKNIK